MTTKTRLFDDAAALWEHIIRTGEIDITQFNFFVARILTNEEWVTEGVYMLATNCAVRHLRMEPPRADAMRELIMIVVNGWIAVCEQAESDHQLKRAKMIADADRAEPDQIESIFTQLTIIDEDWNKRTPLFARDIERYKSLKSMASAEHSCASQQSPSDIGLQMLHQLKHRAPAGMSNAPVDLIKGFLGLADGATISHDAELAGVAMHM
jgi:hypothetical protein